MRTELTIRPMGAPDWIARMEAPTGMILAPGKRGPKLKAEDEE